MSDLRRFTFGDFHFDCGTFQLLRGGDPVPVEPKALDVLRILLERAPRMVEKAEILAIAWRDIAVTDNALTRVIAHLRRALGDDSKAPRYIQTVAARGYRMVADVEILTGTASGDLRIPAPPSAQENSFATRSPSAKAAEEGPAGVLPAVSAEPRATPAARRRWAVALLVAGALVGVGVWAGVRLARRSDARPRGPSVTRADVATLAGLTPQQMTAAKGYDGFLAFSPDGNSFAFSSDRSGALEVYVQGLAEGSKPMALTSNSRHNVQPAWSPDGQFVAYHEMAGDGIWIVPSRGGTARRVSDFGAHPSWSPDGRLLAFHSNPLVDLNPGGALGGFSTIWTVPVQGGRPPTRVTSPSAPEGSHGMPSWWPDGRRIVFAVVPRSGPLTRSELWSVEVPGGALLRVGAHARLTPEFAIAPGGDGILFSARGSHAIWWLPWAGSADGAGEPRPTGLPVTGASLLHIAIGAGGRRVAWTALDSRATLQAVPIDNGARAPVEAPAVLVDDIGWRAGFPAVSSGGRLAFMGNRGGSTNAIYLLDEQGRSKQVTTDPPSHGGPFWLAGDREIGCIADHGDGPGYWAVDPNTGRERPLLRLDALEPPSGTQPFLAAPAAGIALTRDLSRVALALVRDGIPNVWSAALRGNAPVGAFVQRTFEKEGGSYASWSPDGRSLAYQCVEGTDVRVCVVGETAGSRRQLTHERGQDFIGGWSPDGGSIVFAARRQASWNVAAVSPKTATMHFLTAFTEPRFQVRYPRWDATNRRVVFERFETQGRTWSVELPR